MSNNTFLIFAGIVAFYYYFSNNSVESFVSVSNSQISKNSKGQLVLSGAPVNSLFAVTAKWCGYCSKLKDNVTAAKLKNVFYFDATKNNDPAVRMQLDKMEVQSFPTVFKVTSNGVLIPYQGSRAPKDLKSNFV